MGKYSTSRRVLHRLSIVAVIFGLIGPMPIGSQFGSGLPTAPAAPPPRAAPAPIVAANPIMLSIRLKSLDSHPAASEPTTSIVPSVPSVPDSHPAASEPTTPTAPLAAADPLTPTIHLKSRDFQPAAPDRAALQASARADRDRVHILVQLDFIPREAAKAEYERRGLKLLAYVPDYAWIASTPAQAPDLPLSLPGVTWVGSLTVEDKLDPAISNREWGSYNLSADGTAAVYVVIHSDVNWEAGRASVQRYGGRIVGEVRDVSAFVVEMPEAKLLALAAEDDIQWIEPAEPPLGEANDGIRQQIGVDIVQSAPYSLTGSGVDILIYDSGTVTPTHADFSGRLTIGDGTSVRDHSTHVAGTAAGSGALSASAGGTANQWRGMAPGARVVSYGYQPNGTGMLFYNDPGDIQADWAAAQNTYGADVGNASLSSNIYANYPMSCTLMGNYGLTSVLMDQIIRGGNSTVGLGDKYIATWAAGNERPSACSGTGYSTTSPPASAKNPIHVGASNTDNNSMTAFSSWGPTDDGRVKPIVVAGGDQVGGDGAIKSTIPNMFTNSSTRNCDGSGDDYCYPYDTMQGTSMAAPAVAGSLALMLQHYRAVYATSGNFWPSTAKAILMQTADDFGNPGPDYQWGFGQVDIHAAVDLIGRQAFLQGNVAAGSTDVFYFAVPTDTLPAQVSLAWDDYEATFNANPTLINNLDLELVAPSGTIWRPWILDPATPANNATRGVNNRDNQEQVTVPNPEIGTWLVRVKGTTVPQGPQDYSLACEGCKALNLGVCLSTVGGALLLAESTLEAAGPMLNSEGDEVVPPQPPAAPLSAGEQWQRWLDAGSPPSAASVDQDQETMSGVPQPLALSAEAAAERAKQDRIQAALRAFDIARSAGPEAVLAFDATASDEVREVIRSEVEEARRAIAARNAPVAPAAPQAPAAARVGVNGACAYNTIQDAINAAPNGATVRVVGEWFNENIDITGGEVITIEGGYNAACTAIVAGAKTTIDAAVSGSTVDVSGGSRVILRNLNLGYGSSFGAGVDVLGSSHVTLDNVRVKNNFGASGGGFYVGSGSVVTLTNGSNVSFNTGSTGGGAIVYGRLSAFQTTSDFANNCATSDGGNLAVPGGTLYMDDADVVAGTAAGATGRGGGIYATSNAVVTLTNSVFVGESVPCCQTAYEGGGIYADSSRIFLLGSATSVLRNAATNNGGGVYLTNGSHLQSTGANVGNTASAANDNTAILGAGVYAISSTVDFSGRIFNNTASSSGGGLYASASVLTITNATIGGTGVNDPNVIGATGLNGAGLYLINNTHATLSSTVVASNTLTNPSTGYGGGLYVRAGSVVTITNSRIERHYAPSSGDGRGAGLYIQDATVTLSNTQVLSNTAASKGGGARLFGASTLDVLGASSFVNNRALNGEGGAIAATSAPDINVQDATFQYNSASTHGGAIYLDAGTLDVEGAWDIRFNQATLNGGAVAVLGTGDADFRVTGGLGSSLLAVNNAGGSGGALYVTNGDTVQLHAVSGYPLNFNTNTAGGHGGGAYADNGASFDVYGQVQATSNVAGGNGGVFYLGGGSTLWLDDYSTTRPQIWVNTADNGGAIFAANSPRVECDGADFGFTNNGNKATVGSGGAIYLSGSTLTADNCVFRNNQAQQGNGGAIAAYTSTVRIDADYPTPLLRLMDATDPRLDRGLGPDAPLATACDPLAQQCSSLYGNRAISSTASNGNGGAIYVNAGQLHLNDTYLHRNTAARGGAIYQEGSSASGWITNTLIYSNTSLQPLGAGVRVSGGAMTATHATLANNTGGAGYSPGAVQSYLYNTILWGNTVASFNPLTVATCNIDQGGTAGPATNPLFASPGGGEDYHLQLVSPAMDACATGAPNDLDNRARPIGLQFDMGAYEVRIAKVYLPLILR